MTTPRILDRLAPAIAAQLETLATIPAEIMIDGDRDTNPDYVVPMATLDGLLVAFTRECGQYLAGTAYEIAEARGLDLSDQLFERMDALLAAGYGRGSLGYRTPLQAAQTLAHYVWVLTGDEADRARAVLIGADLEDTREVRTMRVGDPQRIVSIFIDAALRTQA